MKRQICFMISIILIITTVLFPDSVCAKEYDLDAFSQVEYSEENFCNYMDLMKREYLKIYLKGKNISSPHSFGYSQEYMIYNCDDNYKRILFLFDGDECIGAILCTFIDGEFASSFIEKRYEVIKDSYQNEEEFMLISVEHSLIFASPVRTMVLEGTEVLNETKIELTAMQMLHSKSTVLQKCVVSPLNYTNQNEASDSYVSYGSTITATYGLLDVPHVSNGLSPNGEGLCWCASISSIAAFRKGTIPISALELYNNLNVNYPGTPTGNATWEKRGFSFYSLSYTYYGSGTTYSGVTGILSQYRPIFASLTTSNGSLGHAVVICGYQHPSGGNYYYTLMDPNVTSKVTVIVSSSSTNFTYVTSSTTYTKWRRRIY
ncbi:MAG: hypothetical protein IJ744_12650 [Lachnospiraceae bacterium]|nr:hypothetical protein [Lachnospiraceae bacterium]